jgi:adenine-specific DNA methylase
VRAGAWLAGRFKRQHAFWHRNGRDRAETIRRRAVSGANLDETAPVSLPFRYARLLVALETDFDTAFTARLALKEKQIQQSYRPIIGIHKWFARRPGTVFRNLLLAEFDRGGPIEERYYVAHSFAGVIADPFAGGGTPVFEANRLGFSVVGCDINPMAYWILRQGLGELDLKAFRKAATAVAQSVEAEVGRLYKTQCAHCHESADVKYFLWVKVQDCPDCGAANDLFPGYLLAEDSRHPKNVLACAHCGELNEFADVPTRSAPARCRVCSGDVYVDGTARRNKAVCRSCASEFRYPNVKADAPPRHRMWAIEYHCSACRPGHDGRFFKRPDERDIAAFEDAQRVFGVRRGGLPIPSDPIPDGDETKRLHRWGYRYFAQMFNDRQLLGLGTLLAEILRIEERSIRHALLTVFSDFLRYQNLLCRYDTYALKCQDVFSVHGFPVGLVHCENSLLGIPKVGSGSFRHFVEKYVRAKEYCLRPFETYQKGKTKVTKYIDGERIAATIVAEAPRPEHREALLVAAPAESVRLLPGSLDGVFTDPPYFDAVQYAELMDFCYAWLKLGLGTEFEAFRRPSTRHEQELTGNDTMGRGLAQFAEGLSAIFQRFSDALKPNAPFVFTYHHNDPKAYAPLVVAILDAGLTCTESLAAPAEMGASLHIAGTSSSVLDTIFVCRRAGHASPFFLGVEEGLRRDAAALRTGGIRITDGDIKCLHSGHVARVAINALGLTWRKDLDIEARLGLAQEQLVVVASGVAPASVSEF